jgi:predicted nucleic acid-binding Zn ribbon protein
MKDQQQRRHLLDLLLKQFSDEKVNRRVGATNWTTINSMNSELHSEPQKWFEDNCFKPISSEKHVLSDKLKEWVTKSNDALSEFLKQLQHNCS